MSRVLQAIIAMIGITLTLGLGVVSARNQNMEARHALLTLFSDSISVARLTCDADMTFVAEDALERLNQLEESRLSLTDEEKAERAANLVSLENYGNNLAELRATISGPACGGPGSAPLVQGPAPGPDLSPSVAAAVTTENMALRVAEAAAPAPAPAAAARAGRAETADAQRGFYVVVASYGVGDASTYDDVRGVAAHYQQIVNDTRGQNVTVHVFRTSISDHFAIALSRDAPTRENARQLVSIARSTLGSPDAFIQQERNWTACTDLSDQALRACGAGGG